jgi:hypothetical protein
MWLVLGRNGEAMSSPNLTLTAEHSPATEQGDVLLASDALLIIQVLCLCCIATLPGPLQPRST